MTPQWLVTELDNDLGPLPIEAATPVEAAEMALGEWAGGEIETVYSGEQFSVDVRPEAGGPTIRVVVDATVTFDFAGSVVNEDEYGEAEEGHDRTA
jgi:hypothetical protein